MRFEKYERPQSFDEALKILKENKGAKIIGGSTFLRLNKKGYKIGIDLIDLDLDYIRETNDTVIIGAYTSLRELEINKIITDNFGDFFKVALNNIIGVQFRNVATVGGTVFGRFGFSDVITAFSVLDCKINFAEGDMMDLGDFLKKGNRNNIIKEIVIMKNNAKTSYQMLRKSDADFPLLTTATSMLDKLQIVVGSRPLVADHAIKAEEFMVGKDLTDENIAQAAQIASEELKFGDDIRSTKDYKVEICKVLIKRAIEGVR